MKKSKNPSFAQCLNYIDKYQMLDNIRDHSHVVAKVAEVLLDGLIRSGSATPPLPDKRELIAGALLHDIAKTLCLKTGCNHAEAGQRICIELGHPEIGKIVVEHVFLKNYTPESYRQGVFTSKEIVFYADKRVRHDKVVSLDERLEYITERYGDSNPIKERSIQLNFKKTVQFEKHLFTFLDFEPLELPAFVPPGSSLTKETLKACS